MNVLIADKCDYVHEILNLIKCSNILAAKTVTKNFIKKKKKVFLSLDRAY